jgi:hypothetical protein
MTDYRRHYDDGPRRHDREWSDRGGDDVRDERYGYGGERISRHEPSRDGFDRGSRWEGAPDDRAYGMYRTDDRDYHDRYRSEHGDRYSHERPSSDRYSSRYDAANEYYRAARDQRDDYLRWSAQNNGTWGDQSHITGAGSPSSWHPRERGGYWRNYDDQRPHFAGRGPKGYQRDDGRVREEICDCMTDDPMLDASEIEVDVRHGEVMLTGSVSSREQKRRAEDVAERISGVRDVTNQLRVTRDSSGHNWDRDSSRVSSSGNSAGSQPATPASGTPSKSTASTTA